MYFDANHEKKSDEYTFFNCNIIILQMVVRASTTQRRCKINETVWPFISTKFLMLYQIPPTFYLKKS